MMKSDSDGNNDGDHNVAAAAAAAAAAAEQTIQVNVIVNETVITVSSMTVCFTTRASVASAPASPGSCASTGTDMA